MLRIALAALLLGPTLAQAVDVNIDALVEQCRAELNRSPNPPQGPVSEVTGIEGDTPFVRFGWSADQATDDDPPAESSDDAKRRAFACYFDGQKLLRSGPAAVRVLR